MTWNSEDFHHDITIRLKTNKKRTNWKFWTKIVRMGVWVAHTLQLSTRPVRSGHDKESQRAIHHEDIRRKVNGFPTQGLSAVTGQATQPVDGLLMLEESSVWYKYTQHFVTLIATIFFLLPWGLSDVQVSSTQYLVCFSNHDKLMQRTRHWIQHPQTEEKGEEITAPNWNSNQLPPSYKLNGSTTRPHLWPHHYHCHRDQ